MIKATEQSKLLLCWSLISCAARHAVSLGFHREAYYSSLPHREAEERRRLFWRMYCHDKNVSLSLGRVAHFRDDDIDTRIFVPSLDPRVRPWDEAVLNYVHLSRIQGYIYEELYALPASKKTAEERNEICERLAHALRQWREGYPTVQSLHATTAHTDVNGRRQPRNAHMLTHTMSSTVQSTWDTLRY